MKYVRSCTLHHRGTLHGRCRAKVSCDSYESNATVGGGFLTRSSTVGASCAPRRVTAHNSACHSKHTCGITHSVHLPRQPAPACRLACNYACFATRRSALPFPRLPSPPLASPPLASPRLPSPPLPSGPSHAFLLARALACRTHQGVPHADALGRVACCKEGEAQWRLVGWAGAGQAVADDLHWRRARADGGGK